MEAAVRSRNAGREAVRDVTPDELRERIYDLLDESAMVPGALVLASAQASEGVNAAGTASATTCESGGSGTVGVEERAAGVQLIYEGLRLTRTLAADSPWRSDPPHTDSNIDVLAADVMVARGFSLLARTEAADKAVETVQSFGRDQTDDQQGRPAPAHALESDVFELAVVAGTAAFGADPSGDLLAYANGLASSLGPDSSEPPESLPEEVEQVITDAPNPRRLGTAEDPRPSATDP